MNIYQQNIIDRYKNPQFVYRDQKFTHNYQIKNLSCGDEIEIFLEIEDEKIINVFHKSRGCAISVAAIDSLCEYLRQKDISEIEELNIDSIKMLLGIEIGESRYKCAMLGIEAIKKYLVRN